jgi:hypothetical protein
MRHVVVDNDTRIVTHILIWNNDIILPPPNTLIFANGIACIGDWWCEQMDTFYTPNKKRRMRLHHEWGEAELSQDEKDLIESKLDAVFPNRHSPCGDGV